MPICDDPNARGYFWLETDTKKPLASRPMFICKFVTRSQRRQVRELLQRARDAKQDSACYLILMESIRLGVVGWQNFGDMEFSEDALADRLTDSEIWELARDWPHAVELSEDDRKNSELPASSGQAECAPSVSSPVAA